jgi:YebC/PmpR family DNA-binding regulatory protein
MSGHSKWATIKRKKASNDAARGRMFTKAIKEITIAARTGGGDPEGNPRLRLAIQSAKAVNMPADNIKRAIQKGTGELAGVNYEEIVYEAYGPGGSALLINVVTDNKNRTVSELRHLLTRNNGKLAEIGSVSWMFEKKGTISILKETHSEDEIMNIALEAGAEDLRTESETYEITTDTESFEPVRKALDEQKYKLESAQLQMLPKDLVNLEGKAAEQMLKLMESLEEHDDVQNVYSNFDIDEKVMASFSQN